MTQVELAKRIGSTQAGLSKALTKGRMEEANAKKVAAILGVNFGDIAEMSTGGNPDELIPVAVVTLRSEIDELKEQIRHKDASIEVLNGRISQLTGIIEQLAAKK